MTSSNLKWICLMLFITIASSNKCPTDCTCSIINENSEQEENHAKCSSLLGFKKTDDDDELLPPIKSLDLSNNGLTKISSQLDKLKFLTEVDLTNNSLSEFSKLNKRVKTLNLSFNQITSAKLVKIPQYVQNLNLSNNEITYIPTEMMRLKNLRSLELSGNFINCSCETLQVRNWLQEQNVYTEKHILCSTPQRFKGRPWLQIKESDACDQENDSMTSDTNFWEQEEDENDIMLADSPILSDVGSGEEESTDDLEKEYLPLGKASIVNEKLDTDGSGDDFDNAPNVRLFNDNVTNSDDEDSGSGDGSTFGSRLADEDSEEDGSGALPIPNFPNISRMGDVIRTIFNDTASIGFDGEEKEDFVPSPIYSPSEDVTRPPPLGIFEGNVHTYKDPVSTETAKPESELIPVEEPIVKRVMEPTVEKENIKLSNIANEKPEDDNNKNAYIFLGVVGLLLIVLIAFVAMKRNNSKRRERKDIENQQGKELVDMERNVLGKPVQKNGVPENSPLLSQQPYFDRIDSPKTTSYQDASPAQKSAPEPVHKPSDLNQNSQPMQSFKPVPSPRSEVDSPSRAIQPNENLEKQNELPIIEEPSSVNSEPKVNGVHDIEDDEVFNPADDPNSAVARYSPVYSPITGRVKIKLTETLKPKTPLLVTRSRSNAGDIITSPNLNQRSPYK